MRGVLGGLAVLPVLLVTAGVANAQQPEQPTFRAAVDLVYFGVMAVDLQVKPVTGLTAAYFEVLENGKRQAVTYFSVEVAP